VSEAPDAPAPYRFSLQSRTNAEVDYMTGLERLLSESKYSATERMINFALYTPRQDFAKLLIKYELFKQVLDIHGSVVECGVFFGGGLMTWAQLSAVLEPSNHQRRVIGFDTFSGFRQLADQDEQGESEEAHEGGLAIDSFEEITRAVELFDMNRSVGHLPKVELVRGDATQTIPAYLEENPHLVISLLYLDFDVYEPTRVALEVLFDRMPKGAIIGFDELNLRDWPGETQALLDTVGVRSLRLNRFPFGSTISYAVLG
jgi:hypothetical protein